MNTRTPDLASPGTDTRKINVSCHTTLIMDTLLPRALRSVAVLAFGGLLYQAAATAPIIEIPEPEIVSEVSETEEIPEETEVVLEEDGSLPQIAVGSNLVQHPDQKQIVMDVPYVKLFGENQVNYLSLSTAISTANGYHAQKLMNDANVLQKQLAAADSSTSGGSTSGGSTSGSSSSGSSASAASSSTAAGKDPSQEALYVEQEKVSLRRVDSRITSLLFSGSSYEAPDRIHYTYRADNYDTATGKVIALSDVVSDIPELYRLVQAQLETFWPYVTCDISAADYLSQTPVQEQVWTLDYNGITFFFEEGTLSSNDGEQCVTVPYSMAPAIFSEACQKRPDVYTVSLTEAQPFYYDVDGDGILDEIIFSLVRNYYGDCEAFHLLINGDSSDADLLVDGNPPENCIPYLRMNEDKLELILEVWSSKSDASEAASDSQQAASDSSNQLFTFTVEKDPEGTFILVFEGAAESSLVDIDAGTAEGNTIRCHQLLTY